MCCLQKQSALLQIYVIAAERVDLEDHFMSQGGIKGTNGSMAKRLLIARPRPKFCISSKQCPLIPHQHIVGPIHETYAVLQNMSSS